jgi:hypothetical protein
MSLSLEDSTTYQLIFNRGYEAGKALAEARAVAREVVLLLGGQRFGEATEAIAAAIGAITDRERLRRIAVRLLTATSWDDLLATP